MATKSMLLIRVVGDGDFKPPRPMAGQAEFSLIKASDLSDLGRKPRPQACLCLQEELLPGLLGLPCPVWGHGFAGWDGCLQADNWQEFLDAARQPLNPGGWANAIYLCMPMSYFWDNEQAYIASLVRALPVNLELGLDWRALDECWPAHQHELPELVKERKISVHMPFMGLAPGSMDPKVAGTALERLSHAGRIAVALKAEKAVFHLGYDPRLDRDSGQFIETVSRHLAPVMEELQKSGCLPVIENVFEPDPAVLLAVRREATRLTGKKVGFCLDVGHALAFTPTPLREWWQAFEPFLMEMHLHDNPGHDDLHQAIGSGQVDFAYLGRALKNRQQMPQFTLELRDEPAFWQSLRMLDRLWGPADKMVSNVS